MLAILFQLRCNSLVLMFGLFLTSAICTANESFYFALIGDLPYGVKIGEKDEKTNQLITQLNSDASLSWVLHVGDIKTGSSKCSDEMLKDRKQRFEKLNAPFIFTPGDNEWTDCHRLTAGRFDPLERLSKLREMFFLDNYAHKARNELSIIQQAKVQTEHSAFIENYTWIKNGVQFSTVHTTGSLNGKKKFSKISGVKYGDQHKKEVKQREKAARDWVAYTFQKAKENNAKAVFIATHANPGLDRRWANETKPHFKFLNEALANELEHFDKPVVLAHGDSHYARIDNPSLVGKKVHRQFLRLESFGENNNAWIKVHVDPNSPNVFSFAFFDDVKPIEID